LSYPISSDFHTEQDYLNEISTAQAAGLPPSVMDTIIGKYLKSTFYNERNTAMIFDLVVNADRVLSLNNDDILLKLGRGVIEKWEVILHDSALNLINELEEKNEGFFEQDFLIQREQLIALAKEKAAAMPGVPQLGGKNIVASILNPAA